jgi:hypothetical protein
MLAFTIVVLSVVVVAVDHRRPVCCHHRSGIGSGDTGGGARHYGVCEARESLSFFFLWH